MIVDNSDYGMVVFGKVVKIKPGSGRAKESLTIVTLADVDEEGKETGGQVKILFWNSRREDGPQLSDRARKLRPGSLITTRAVQDEGDKRKFTGFELKFSGLYRLLKHSRNKSYVLSGKVTKIVTGRGVKCLYIPVNSGNQTIWYRITMWGEASLCDIIQGDYIVARSKTLKESFYNGFRFVDLTSTAAIAVHGK